MNNEFVDPPAAAPDEEPLRIPVYFDTKDRGIVDFNHDGAHEPDEWHPMNSAAEHLCNCHVALGDLTEAVEHCLATSDPKKRRRRMRAASVPLHTLCLGIVDVINAIQSDPSKHSEMPATVPKDLNSLRSKLVALIPFDRKGKLGVLRNKISAHLDKRETPSEMREIARSVQLTEFGEWINIAAAILCDLLKLEAYTWSADGPRSDTVTIMCQEPIMSVLLLKDREVIGIEGIYSIKRSPKYDVLERIAGLCKLSAGLFEKASPYQIEGFYKDDGKQGWSSILRNMPV